MDIFARCQIGDDARLVFEGLLRETIDSMKLQAYSSPDTIAGDRTVNGVQVRILFELWKRSTREEDMAFKNVGPLTYLAPGAAAIWNYSYATDIGPQFACADIKSYGHYPQRQPSIPGRPTA